jgi:hypothetical protein
MNPINYIQNINCFPQLDDELRSEISRVAREVFLLLGVVVGASSIILACAVHPLFGCGIAIALSCIGISMLIPTSTIHKQARLFYHKVLPHGTRRKQFEGNTQKASLKSLKQDLKTYAEAHPFKKALYEPIIKQFEQAQSCAFSINELSVDEVLLIPGGCVKHAVLYVIKRESQEHYKFTLINTGLGLRKAPFVVDEEGLLSLPPKKRMVDCSYTKLDRTVLTDEFIQSLLAKKMSEKSMEEVNRFIEEKLYSPALQNWQLGRFHKAQSNGTCSMSCLLAYLRNALGKEEYQYFKEWMIRQNIFAFEGTIAKEMPSNPIYKEMLEEGYKIHEKSVLGFKRI